MDETTAPAGPPGPQPDQHPPRNHDARWLIYSREHKAFWREMRVGYTTDLDQAGRYPTAEALQLVREARAGGEPKDPRAKRDWPPEAMMLAPECAPGSVLMDSLSEGTSLALTAFLTTTQMIEGEITSHGALDLQRLVRMLLEDVALMIHRPGSWEGHGMQQLMGGHGYTLHQHDAICAAVRKRYWKGKDPYADGAGRLRGVPPASRPKL